MSKIPVIIDCDPGVDDSFAIALANSYSGFDIVAITAVEGNVPAVLTRKNALCLCDTLGLNATVGFGAEKPLVRPYFRDASVTHGESGVGTVQFKNPIKTPDSRPAWELIYDEAVKYNGELVLVAIGPLTNIATALRRHPDLPKYIKKFYIMGGGTFGNVTATGAKAEFNIWVDPLAAKEVFEKMEVYMVGLNATHSAAITEEDFDEMISLCGNDPKSNLIKELSKFSKFNSLENGQDNHIIHDALAIASLMNEDVVDFEDYFVWVEDNEEADNVGETVIDFNGQSGKPANCHVAMKVNQPLFVQMMKNMCKFYNENNITIN